ncbi:MAG TPA: hypothetical protein VIV58_32150 [Kofleriaceae bacterium]
MNLFMVLSVDTIAAGVPLHVTVCTELPEPEPEPEPLPASACAVLSLPPQATRAREETSANKANDFIPRIVAGFAAPGRIAGRFVSRRSEKAL